MGKPRIINWKPSFFIMQEHLNNFNVEVVSEIFKLLPMLMPTRKPIKDIDNEICFEVDVESFNETFKHKLLEVISKYDGKVSIEIKGVRFLTEAKKILEVERQFEKLINEKITDSNHPEVEKLRTMVKEIILQHFGFQP